jgi:prophage antirepressor-like protein
MENALQIFEKEGHPIEVIFLNGEPLFNARQVGEGLMIGEGAVRKCISEMDNRHYVLVTNGMVASCSDVTLSSIRKLNNRGETFLKESGLYRLIFQSRKPEAETFKDWLAMEVLPALRKTGSYGVAQAPQTFAEALRMLADKVEESEKAKQQLQLVSGKLIETEHDRQVLQEIIEPQGYIRLGDAAKIIGHPRLGPNNIFKFLIGQGVLMKCEHDEKPYSFYAKYARYFRMRSTRQNGGRTDLPYSQVVVNFAGLKWIMKKAVEVHGPWNGLMSLTEIAAQFQQNLENGEG